MAALGFNHAHLGLRVASHILTPVDNLAPEGKLVAVPHVFPIILRKPCVMWSDEELLKILRGKLRREQLEAGVEALMAAASVLAKKRATASHFGNGGDVATLLSEAKLRKENRRKDDSMESRRVVRSAVGCCSETGMRSQSSCVAWCSRGSACRIPGRRQCSASVSYPSAEWPLARKETSMIFC